MPGTTPEKSPLARLVLFMFCLSIAATIVAGAHYAVIDLPRQNAVQIPTNDASDLIKECYFGCTTRGIPEWICRRDCGYHGP